MNNNTYRVKLCKKCFSLPIYSLSDNPCILKLFCNKCNFTELCNLTDLANYVCPESKEFELCNYIENNHSEKAIIFCKNCKKLLCIDCKDKHDKQPSYNEHILSYSSPSIPSNCSNHPENSSKYFCNLCKEQLCQECWENSDCPSSDMKHNVHRNGITTNYSAMIQEYEKIFNKGVQKFEEITKQKNIIVQKYVKYIADIEQTFHQTSNIISNLLAILKSLFLFSDVQNTNIYLNIDSLIQSCTFFFENDFDSSFNSFDSFHEKYINYLDSIVPKHTFDYNNNNNHKDNSFKILSEQKHSNKISAILETIDKKIILGNKEGLIQIYFQIYFLQQPDKPPFISQKIHNNKITSLCELSEHRIISASKDCSIKVWKLFPSINELQLIETLSNNKQRVDYVLSLTNNRFISCSNKMKKIRLWECSTYTQVMLPQEEYFMGNSVYQLKHQKEIITFNTSSSKKKNIVLSFYSSLPPYQLKGSINSVSVLGGFGELSDGTLIVCGKMNLALIDCVKYELIKLLTPTSDMTKQLLHVKNDLFCLKIYTIDGVDAMEIFTIQNGNYEVIRKTKYDVSHVVCSCFMCDGMVYVQSEICQTKCQLKMINFCI